MERLCFGTFMDVIVHCRKARISKKQLTGTIIQTIDPNSKYMDTGDEIGRALNHLYKCTGDFSPKYSSIVQLAPKVRKEDVLQQFEDKVIALIAIDKREQVIFALCDIIKKDATLNYESGGENVEKFQSYVGKDIKDFLNASEYILSKFLAEIFLYTVIEIKNTVGEEWLKKISAEYKNYEKFFESYINGFKDLKNTIQVCDTVADKNAKTEANQDTEEKAEPIDVISQQMLKIFKQEYSDCHIKEFLANDLCKEISRDTLTWVDRFVETIESDIIQIYSGERLDAKTKIIYDNISRYAKTLCKYKNDLVERIKKVHEWRKNAPSALASSINGYLKNHPSEDTVTVEPYCEPDINDEFLQHTRKKLDTFHTQICGNDNN